MPRPQARAEAEKTRRKFTVALAGALLLAVTVGGGSWMAFRLDRDARMADTDRTVGDALGRAEALRAEAERAGADGLEAWSRALAAAEKARDLLAGRAARPDLAGRVDALHEAVAQRDRQGAGAGGTAGGAIASSWRRSTRPGWKGHR